MKFGVFVNHADNNPSSIIVSFVKPVELHKKGFNDKIVRIVNLEEVLEEFIGVTYSSNTLFAMKCSIEYAIQKVFGNINIEHLFKVLYDNYVIDQDKPQYETEFDDAKFIIHSDGKDYYLRNVFGRWVIGIVYSDNLLSSNSFSLDYILNAYNDNRSKDIIKLIHPDVIIKTIENITNNGMRNIK